MELKPLSPLEMIICTFKARITPLGISHHQFIQLVEPQGAIKAINCNFGHKAQEGFEKYLRKGKKVTIMLEVAQHHHTVASEKKKGTVLVLTALSKQSFLNHLLKNHMF